MASEIPIRTWVVPLTVSPLVLFYDNNGVVAKSTNPRNHQKDKHIEKKYHLIHEIVLRGDVAVEKIASIENLMNPFTKTLFTRVFNGHRDNLGVKRVSNML